MGTIQMDLGKEEAADHGGGIDEAALLYGGSPADWLDLSTGINPIAYEFQALEQNNWQRLPSGILQAELCAAARTFWQVPGDSDVIVTPGLSAVIAILPHLLAARSFTIRKPAYNEYERAFRSAGLPTGTDVDIIIHPNNPDGVLSRPAPMAGRYRIIDESFCDLSPSASRIREAALPGHLVLKSFGKFWGLAGLRLGFVIGDPALVADLKRRLGPWPVSGPALRIGLAALTDRGWADVARQRLQTDAERLDMLFTAKGARLVGGTSLFRLYDVGAAADWYDRLARQTILTRIFPYSATWLRVGLPGTQAEWSRLEAAL